MIVSDGYSLMYDEKHNRIVIGLPQTWKTLTNTFDPVADRRIDVSETDLIVLLNIAPQIFHKGIRMDGGENG